MYTYKCKNRGNEHAQLCIQYQPIPISETNYKKSKCISVRYKQQVSSGLQREQALEQKRVQLELDWERRCEEVRAEHYLRSEELIQSLTQTRDQVS